MMSNVRFLLRLHYTVFSVRLQCIIGKALILRLTRILVLIAYVITFRKNLEKALNFALKKL